MAAKTEGRYPCLTDKNCATYAHCHDGKCLCSDELYGDGEKCKPGENNLTFYVCHYMNDRTELRN